MISIVIPLYNKEKQIKNTLKSIFNQTFQDYEIVIVNDGSTDKSVEIVKRINDTRIRLIEQKNQGVSVARNTGIKEAKYEYIALLDADDEWKPNYLETQVDLIYSYPNCSVFACAYEFKNGEKITPLILNKIPFEGEKGVLTNYFEVAACSHPPISSISIVAKRASFLAIGGFPVGVIEGEDLITWAKLAVKYSIAYSTKREVYFLRNREESLSQESPRILRERFDLGKEFELLYTNNPQMPGLKKYIAHWYKMRASMFLLAQHRKECWRESIKSLIFDPLNVKVWIYLILIPFPKSFTLKIFRKFAR